jgi:hypothetical protein
MYGLYQTKNWILRLYNFQFYSIIWFNDILSIIDTKFVARKEIEGPIRK